jgi:hypothetical protein
MQIKVACKTKDDYSFPNFERMQYQKDASETGICI